MALESINIVLPRDEGDYFDRFAKLLADFGVKQGDSLTLTPYKAQYLPVLGIHQGSVDVPEVVIDELHVQIRNTTGIVKENALVYTSISLDDAIDRLCKYQMNKLDHIGFNLPYFDGIHPEVLGLREMLRNRSLYHLFPSGEPWDFIIPGTVEEIRGSKVDYSIVRKPKFEIVSFDGCSKPLIQFDFSVKASYPEIVSSFPEGIKDDNLHNVWVYIENPYGIDICLVVNEPVEGDWNSFFKNSRLG